MEQESNILHLLKEHQFILFVAGALLIMAILVGFGILIGNRMERRRRETDDDARKRKSQT